MKLATKRLVLRDLMIKDEKSIVENANNLKVSRYLSHVPYPYSLKDAKWFISKCIKDSKEKPRKNYEFGIEFKSEKKLIGMLGLNGVDEFQGTAIVGYWLGKKYWRQGIMSEALKKLLDFGFNKLRLRKINVSAFTVNKGSNAIIKKFGFKKEGIGRKSHRAKSTGKIYDVNYYGLLKEEFKK